MQVPSDPGLVDSSALLQGQHFDVCVANILQVTSKPSGHFLHFLQLLLFLVMRRYLYATLLVDSLQVLAH